MKKPPGPFLEFSTPNYHGSAKLELGVYIGKKNMKALDKTP